ncbi:hypothetical protein [Shewanella baltica]
MRLFLDAKPLDNSQLDARSLDKRQLVGIHPDTLRKVNSAIWRFTAA